MSGMPSLIGQLGIFMICAQAIMHFRPKEAYEKYLRLLLSIMILMQIIQPVYSFFQRSESTEWEVSLEYFQKKLDESMDMAVEQAATSEKLFEQMTLEEVQTRIDNTAQEGVTTGNTATGSTETGSTASGSIMAESIWAGSATVAEERGDIKEITVEVETVQVEPIHVDAGALSAGAAGAGEQGAGGLDTEVPGVTEQSEVEP